MHFFLFLFLLCSREVSADTISPFEVIWSDTPVRVAPQETVELTVTIRMPEGHYLYTDKTRLEFQSLEGVHIDEIEYPASVVHHDPYLNQDTQVFVGEVSIVARGRTPAGAEPGLRELSAVLGLQGCTPQLCLRPEERLLLFRIEVVHPQASGETDGVPSGDEPASRFSVLDSIREEHFSDIVGQGWGWALLIVFIAGVLTSLTPCVWPVIPVVLLIVGIHPDQKIRRNIALTLSLVAGTVLVYAALGVAAAALGKSLGFLFQNKLFLFAVVVFFIMMSLSMFGLFEIRLPQHLHQRMARLGGRGYRGAFLAGLGTGVIASPCVGPVVAGILTYVVLQKSYALGFLLLLVYGAGMGLLFILLGLTAAQFAQRLKSGTWMVWIKRCLGVLLLLPALFYVQSLTGIRWADVLHPPKGPGIQWVESVERGLSMAEASRRPIVMDFYADWCPPCRSLERWFFRRSDVVQLSAEFIPVRVDATVETQEIGRILDHYGVAGLPTILFFSPDGIPYDDLRVSAFDPDRILASMHEAIHRSTP